MFIVLAILAFGLLIAFHEAGHMWVARRMGMRVERFSIGFGPAIYSWRSGETDYVLSALPLGGYVKISGMATEDEVDEKDPASYANKPAWRRFLAIAAGPFANFFLAFLIGVPLLMVGSPVSDPSSRIGLVSEGGAAERAGLKPGDEILKIGEVTVTRFLEIPKALQQATGGIEATTVPFTVRRNGQELLIEVTPSVTQGAVYIGVGQARLESEGLGFFQALPQAASNVYRANVATFESLARMFSGAEKANLSGPIGILSHTAEQARRGALEYFMTVWSISIAIGFFNLLPLPGLDGGRLAFLIYEIVARRRVNQKVEGWIHTIGVLALLGLILFVSYGDIMRKFGN